jgi:hypothetical protein
VKVQRRASPARVSSRSLLAALALSAAALSPLRPTAAQVAGDPAQRQRPATAMYRQLVPGLLARTRIAADAPRDRRVELWDLLVGPGKRSDSVTLPGGVVLEVRAGSGRIIIAGRERELRPGSTLAIADGTPFVLVNGRDDLGLSLRATVISARRR